MILGPITGLVVRLAIFKLGMAMGIRSEQGRPGGSRQNDFRSSIGLTGHSSSAAAAKKNVRRYGTYDPAIHGGGNDEQEDMNNTKTSPPKCPTGFTFNAATNQCE